jgi:hypothetical protein
LIMFSLFYNLKFGDAAVANYIVKLFIQRQLFMPCIAQISELFHNIFR